MDRNRGCLGERGASAVEFAILLPLLMMILFGIVEFSLIMYDKALITSASRDGARYGSLFRDADRPTCDEITDAVRAYEQQLFVWNIAGRQHDTEIDVRCLLCDLANPPNCQDLTESSDGICPDAPAGERLAVETVFDYGFYELITQLTGPITLRSTTIMNCE